MNIEDLKTQVENLTDTFGFPFDDQLAELEQKEQRYNAIDGQDDPEIGLPMVDDDYKEPSEFDVIQELFNSLAEK